MSKPSPKVEIENAASEAVQTLAHAAQTAVQTISDAASAATKVIAASASDAAKLTAVDGSKNSADHDLLVEMKTKMEGLKEDIRLLRSEQVEKVTGHETRLNSLENSNIRQTVCLAVGTLWLVALTAMLVYHLFKMPMQ